MVGFRRNFRDNLLSSATARTVLLAAVAIAALFVVLVVAYRVLDLGVALPGGVLSCNAPAIATFARSPNPQPSSQRGLDHWGATTAAAVNETASTIAAQPVTVEIAWRGSKICSAQWPHYRSCHHFAVRRAAPQ